MEAGWADGSAETKPASDFLRPSVGGLDTVLFQGQLYLVFTTDAARGYLTLARCVTATGGCSDSTARWYDFGGGQRWYRVPGEASYHARPRAAAGTRLMGSSLPGTEYLYVVGATWRPEAYQAIHIVQIGNDHLVHSSGYVPSHYPSYRTYGPVAVIVRRSAFSDRNYLYLAWSDADTSELYVSVVQTWDDVDGSDTWFTRSATMGVTALGGASWISGFAVEESVTRLVIAEGTEGALRYGFVYGRY